MLFNLCSARFPTWASFGTFVMFKEIANLYSLFLKRFATIFAAWIYSSNAELVQLPIARCEIRQSHLFCGLEIRKMRSAAFLRPSQVDFGGVLHSDQKKGLKKGSFMVTSKSTNLDKSSNYIRKCPLWIGHNLIRISALLSTVLVS